MGVSLKYNQRKKHDMSRPKLKRNIEIVKLRLKNPEKWSYEALRKKYGFKSRGTVQEIIKTFTPKFAKMAVDKSVQNT